MHLSNLPPFLGLMLLFLGSILIFRGNISKRSILHLIFILYISALIYIVTTDQDVYYDVNTEPFREILRYDIDSPLFIKNIIGNILLFMPLGFFLTFYLKIKHFYIIILTSLYFSFCTEAMQLLIGRIFDIDDILLNIVGAYIGYIIFRIVVFLKNKI